MEQSVDYKLKMKAYSLCDELFKDKVDKAGEEYMHHLIFVSDLASDMMPIPGLLAETRTTAMLHDILEDCGDQITEEQLKEMFGERISQNVKILTKATNGLTSYRSYITLICDEYAKGNIVPLYVKLADLTHNMDIRRLNRRLDEKDFSRLKKYMDAYLLLNETIQKHSGQRHQNKVMKFYGLSI